MLDEIEFYKTFGIKKVGVFGSFARGEMFRDIDLYIDEELDYKRVNQIRQVLELQTGIPFDIMLKKNAEPIILHRAFKEMKYATAY